MNSYQVTSNSNQKPALYGFDWDAGHPLLSPQRADLCALYNEFPLAMNGGVIALGFHDIPFAITAGVGFITPCGVSVLTGVKMVSVFKDMLTQSDDTYTPLQQGAILRLRPI